MNRRILKKATKRAAQFLRDMSLSRGSQIFASTNIGQDREYIERGGLDEDYRVQREAKAKTKLRKRRCFVEDLQALDGTMFIGAMSGYYEPEWDQNDCFSELQNHLRDHFTDWDLANRTMETTGKSKWVCSMPCRTVRDIYAAAEVMARELKTPVPEESF